MTPREQAIEKIADIISKKLCSYKFDDWTSKNVAEAILDALNIEVLGSDIKIELHDVLQGENYYCQVAVKFMVDNEFNYPLERYRIILRNNKPSVYVENIGGNNAD